jgi:hypothetical protein
MGNKLVVGLAVVIGCVVVGVVAVWRQAVQQPALQPVNAKHEANLKRAKAQVRPVPAPVVAPATPRRVVPAEKAGGMVNVRTQAVAAAAQASQAPPARDAAPQDPLARLALSFVGADPDADRYWIEAINNPSLPAQERQDLIEDLNEDGLSDPQNPTVSDLPLILSRLALIEQLAPDAMDEVNAAAFQEANKDLTNMVARLTRQ